MTLSRNTVLAFVAAVGIFSAGVVTTKAATGDEASAFVPISPCRLADTRPASNRVGPTGTFTPEATTTFQTTGSNGECTNIPDEATAVSLNVTAVGATAQSFLTFWPSGERPLAASLNPAPGQPPVPNAVVVALSSGGSFEVFNNAGDVNIVVDVNGYYVPSTSGPAGAQGPQGEPGLDGSDGPVDGSACVVGGIEGTVQTSFDIATGALDVRCSRPGFVSTFAGTAGGVGSTDATGSAARFDGPRGVALDSAGNVYVADGTNHTIRKITPAGAVSTLAGTAGSTGSADGTGSAARFAFPASVAVDAAGNVYVAGRANDVIRKITPAGVVSTLAGTAGSVGSADGTGSAARFNNPISVAVDAAGNVYVADSFNDMIRKITPAGEVTTLAGSASGSGSADGTGSAARFNNPFGVAVDAAGNVYVADFSNHTIRKITPGGEVSTLAGSAGNPGSADGTGSAARFDNPHELAVDAAGNIYVADSDNNTIRRVTPAGEVTTVAGLAGSAGSTDATGATARFNDPVSVALDAADNIYVADSGNNTIRKIN